MRPTLFGICAVAAALWLSGSPAMAAEKAEAGVTARTRLLTLDYANAEVADVIRALASQSGMNVALNQSVKGQVTVHLKEKTPDEAIQVVANLAGLGARKVNDTYVVAPRAEMRQTLERLGATRSVNVTHLTAQAAADLAQGAFPDLTARPQGKAIALVGASEDLDAAERLVQQNDVFSPESERVTEKVDLKHRPAAQMATSRGKMTPGLSAEAAGSAIVLTGTRAQVDTARRAVALLDVQAQPDVDVRVYEIRYTPPAQLMEMVQRVVPDVTVLSGPDSYTPPRPNLNIMSGQFVGFDANSSSQTSQNSTQTNPEERESTTGNTKSEVSGPINKRALTLLLKGPPAAIDQAMKVLAMVDVAPKQMMIEAKVVETSPETAEQIGVKWSWTRFGMYEAAPGTEVNTSQGGIGGDFSNFTTRDPKFGVFSRVPWSFNAYLNAMITKRDAKILANPKITVLNDQDASIFIGDTLRFQALAQAGPTTGAQYTVLEVPVGIILLVHPRVNDDGNITMRVHPVVSTVTGLVNGLPQTSAREAETSVRVVDGDTLVMGGLIRDEDLREMTKIPILGDLPLIGQLFRNTDRKHRRTEIMVVLTIRLLR